MPLAFHGPFPVIAITDQSLLPPALPVSWTLQVLITPFHELKERGKAASQRP